MGLDPVLAGRLGRPDQARSLITPVTTADASSREPGVVGTNVQVGARFGQFTGNVQGSLDSGRITALTLAAILGTLVLFHWWTRGHHG